MARTVDVAIIGGGVIGSAIALYLSMRGFACELFEQREFGWGASGATAGVIGPLWHVPHTHDSAMELGLSSLREFPRLTEALAETGVSTGFRKSGILNVARTEEEERTLREGLTWQGELGLGVRWVDAAESAGAGAARRARRAGRGLLAGGGVRARPLVRARDGRRGVERVRRAACRGRGGGAASSPMATASSEWRRARAAFTPITWCSRRGRGADSLAAGCRGRCRYDPRRASGCCFASRASCRPCRCATTAAT